MSSVSVNPKCVTKEYSYLIKLLLREDCFPINARMTKCAIEKNREDKSPLICRLTLGHSNLSLFARGICLSKPEKIRIYQQKHTVTEHYECLRSLNADRNLDIADSFSHALQSDANR